MNQSVTQDYKKYIPSYDVLFSNPQKLRECCLVIPVINEGERIHALLERINELDLQSTVDFIIVDGGTTDGSLDESYLKSQHVHSLLLKTAKGKLSAQLLCAYDYAQKLGYKGIVTIDGNNKDDPAPIPDFIKKLNEGYDFIQASRFISGGTAVNTPVSRDLAIRFIHAPVLSIASGFHWTDTTQGFRAYSANFLFNSKVAIFREVFSCYELLAYLSYIGPKLHFKCLEMPSKRSYPKGQVPTKISSVKGNIELLKVLFKAALGKYNLEAE
ncbi:dolichol-phosphate mannosyltransferase [Succinivibrio dextrinosolvens]|uniref:glycosyltransferase family 2 protein n=1 Tax=Succinivibrio dextrinosolvens TaxID=83771 RepID=UPI0008EB35DF|nr:glycosyltransferase family 2 protein [Succinivibrio dextrinosolvens]SFS83055.1 dolichol-phosphate mannosyltransferase [Succinivibrio dextrinosolvens]